jgi:hypothetical protein
MHRFAQKQPIRKGGRMWLIGLMIFGFVCAGLVIFAVMSNDHIDEDYEESMRDMDGIEEERR